MSDNMELTKLTEKPKLLLQNHLRISLKKKNQKKVLIYTHPIIISITSIIQLTLQ